MVPRDDQANKDGHNDPLISSRIIKTYVEYTQLYYPDVDIDSILSYAGIKTYELEDQGHWFRQNQVDRFHQILAQKTGDSNISREVGRYAATSKASGTVRKYALGFMSPAAAYWVAQSLGSRLVRSHTFKTKKLRADKIEITVTPNPGVQDKPYQCDNRMGHLEAISKLFTNKFAVVEHPTCIHRGANICRYIVTWEKTPPLVWRRIRSFVIFFGLLTFAGVYYFLPFASWITLALILVLLIAGISLYAEHLEKEELAKTIESQGDAAKGHIDEINIRYNNALLVQEIGQATSTILDRDELLHTVVGIMERRLDFDRGMVMLANEDKTRLVHTAGYGYSKEKEELLNRTEFHLDNPESKGIFVVAFRDQRPFLINDLAEDSSELSERSRELAAQMDAHSLICVPIVYEQESVGIIAVDNIESKRPLTQSDMSLLQGVASQTAVSMINAMSFQRLQESEAKYRTILEGTQEGYFEIDPAGNLTFFNESLSKISGYPLSELKGMNYRDYTTPETAEKMYQVFNEIYQTRKPAKVIDYEIITKDGSTVVVGMSASLIQDASGQPTGFRGVVRDVTERKRAEEALRASEERYRTVLEANPDPVVVYDVEGKVIYFNPAFTEVFGWSLEERLGQKMDLFVPEENWPETRMMIEKMVAGVTFSGVETRRYTKDGKIIPVSISGSTYRDRDGHPIGSVNALRDISEQKKLEAQLQRAQKMEAIGTLAGGVAHDLNNILSGLVSYPELLLMELPQDSHLRRPIVTIQNSGEKAAAIVQDLLTLARRGVAATTEVVNLNHIISEYLSSPEYEKLKLYHPDVRLDANFEKDLLPILGSPVHLSKTIMNLVSNAAESITDGGTVGISTENRYIDSPIRGYDHVEEGDYVTLTVSDTGVGIPQKDIEKIFEPFYTKKVMGRSGTGLGMAVVWGTVKDHKGYIDVQSSVGEGTAFTLYFPITRKKSLGEEATLSMEEYMGNGESVLVVDDVEEQREIAFEMLSKLGYSTKTVSSGAEAVEHIKANQADLVVLDMIMDPGIDGLETYKRILKFHPGQKAIIVSGFSETKRVKEAQKLGAGAYVKKPYTLDKLGTAVKAELRR
jgi:PAS domain S-box-containing protein